MSRHFRYRRSGRFSILTALIYIAVIALIYSVFIVVPMVQEYYRVREVLTAHAYEGYRDRVDQRLREKLLAAAKKAKVDLLPGNIVIRRHRNPPSISIEAHWISYVKFPFTGITKPYPMSQTVSTTLEKINWNEEKEKGIFD